MSSADPPLDLARDLPTTAEDVEAQRRLRRASVGDPWEALQRLHDSLPEAARAAERKTDRGRPELEL